jgi:uncharacterized protein (DUF1015 family)
VYILEQTFPGLDGRSRTRRGFIAACRVDDFSAGTVLPHERTLSKPKEDRFRLMQATNTNFSQIFSIYSDPEGVVDAMLHSVVRSSPLLDVGFEGVSNRLWAARDAATIGLIGEAMKKRPVLIADGHHRYETALAYRDLMRIKSNTHSGEEPFEFTMMFFAGMDTDGLIVFPTHRLVHGLDRFALPEFLKNLERDFSIAHHDRVESLLSGLTAADRHSFGLVSPEAFHLLRLREGAGLAALTGEEIPAEVRELDVTLLHSYIFERVLHINRDAQERKLNLDYVRTPEEVVDAVRNGRAQAGFLMNPTRLEQIRRVTRAGFTMPQKSTFFYPKLVSGLVINPLD